ncbi:TonB-dependent receptor [Alkalimonas collagenimarina]|uniref:TonB-dependent receptor n=1 Tax=Alkalimonas collagenimarina TaxID=400390 RepID=A0ABT9GX00_9GAMM|nr:TonB-dependent receptor [Alkalimonas collagenimarina]MDP4535210.1 TonB-dependent receptor [Alkalimonas collagenimarina]
MVLLTPFARVIPLPETIMRCRYSVVAACILASFAATAEQEPIERLEVQGDFRRLSVQNIAGSIAVVSEQDMQRSSAQHLDDVLNQLANVNFAAGASRGRFVQMRGIGERSEFIDVINPSVGVLIDGIDYSGLGISSIAHAEQLEVFRGPEATRFGTNAMAGMLNLSSKQPDFRRDGAFSATLANYNSWQLSGMFSDAISEQVAFSLTVDKQVSDGFIENAFLERKDTNDIDELTTRARLLYRHSDDLALQLIAHHIDQNNGYDAFSLDRNRTTLSDEPGQDKLNSKALALRSDYSALSGIDMMLQLSWLSADSDYSFDEDWSFVGISPGWEYSYFDRYLRSREQWTVDYRLVSDEQGRIFGNTDWVLGFYGSSRDLDLQRLRRAGSEFREFDSSLQRDNLAVYGETSSALSEQWTLVVGGRVERYKDDYRDSGDLSLQERHTMWGGKLSLNYQASEQAMIYTLLSRGYKVGGVNGEALSRAGDDGFSALLQQATFEPETLVNAEFGVKGAALDGSLVTRVAAFHMWRHDMQVKGWLNPDLGPEFAGFIDNAGRGRNYGIEMENRIVLHPSFILHVNAGLLKSKLGPYVTGNEPQIDMTGRDQAHAPRFTYQLAGDWYLTEQLMLQGSVQGKSRFYYSDGHNARSSGSEVVNLRLSYQLEQWQLALWVRNALDQDTAVRGFYFGNDPRDEYVPHTYEQWAEPRRFGVTASYQF